MIEKVKTINILFSGRVHGVGFRLTAYSIANRHKIFGWVKNIPEGKVEILAQGKQENIDLFLNSINDFFKHHIDDYNVKQVISEEKYSDFQVRF